MYQRNDSMGGAGGNYETDAQPVPNTEKQKVFVHHNYALDPGEFSLWVQNNYDRLLAVAMKIIKHPHNAEDIVHDSIVKILEQAETFRGEAPFDAWANRIVVNAALVLHRRNRYRVPINPQTAVAKVVPDPTPTAYELIAAAETPAQVYRAIQDLASISPRDKEIAQARFYDGLSLRAVMRKFDLTSAAAKSVLHRVRGRLRVHFKRLGMIDTVTDSDSQEM